MIKNLLFTLLIFFCMSSAYATHIVGGELGMKFISGNTYELSLTLYFDKINGLPEALDRSVLITIFDKRTHQRKASYTLPLTTTTPLRYINPVCAEGKLRTDKLYYVLPVNFDRNAYTEPLGYYIIWERCCRNRIIRNIVDPGGVGQSFYMEFPPLMKNGAPFNNSSPGQFPPLTSFTCKDQKFSFDFGGTDPDGDKLVYSLTAPWRGHTSTASGGILPPPLPAPYAPVTWLPKYSEKNMIPGNPGLYIDRNNGKLGLTPSDTGLFVFGVICEEFRNGVKIGEVRRDFQMLVLDCSDGDAGFDIGNVITPNADNRNDTFKLPDDLSEDNCKGDFLGVVIYNRWGKQVFSSTDRSFAWIPEGYPAGVYFFHIKYTFRQYSNSLTIVR